MRYDNADYAASRLRNSMLFTKKYGKKKPYHIDNVSAARSGRLIAGCHLLVKNDTGKGTTMPLDEFDLSNSQLGYVQLDTEVLWLSRSPNRRNYRQGLRVDNILSMVYNGRSSGLQHATRGGAPLGLREIASAISQDYTSFFDALEMSEDVFKAVPFSNDFAVYGGDKLLYQNMYAVGSITDNKEAVLGEPFACLAELLEAAILNSNNQKKVSSYEL
jgi:hypothetical protein